MIFQEIDWIRSNIEKLCPTLMQEILEWYKPFRFIPSFLQNPFKRIRQLFHKVPIIVQMDNSMEFSTCREGIISSAGCKIEHELNLIHGFSTKVNAKKFEQLVRHSSVKKVWFDSEVKAVLDVASKVVESSQVWDKNITGKGVTVAVLDTGIYEHPDISSRITGFKDFVKGKTSPYDDNGHGTHVAGDIASNGSKSGSSYSGPAPEANLVGVKVLDKKGSGLLSTVIKGIQWVISNKVSLGIRVINMSLGSSARQSYKDDPVCQAVEAAWNQGIVVCAAAGNEGPEESTINSPGIDPMIITVGATDDMNSVSIEGDLIANFSSRGPTPDKIEKPDVTAPGTNIISLRSPCSTLDRKYKSARVGDWYLSLSGTSMATPICAGVVALLLQADSSLTPDEVKELLKNTARPLPGFSPDSQGKGLIDAQAVINKINTSM